MSDRSTITTRSKLRKLEEAMKRRQAIESDSGVPTEMAPGSPSIAPTTTSVAAPVIPLTGGRVVDHREIMETPVRTGRGPSARSRTSHVSSKSGQRSADYLRRRVEYEAERELVRIRENLVKKKLEADLAEIDAAVQDSESEDDETTRRVEEWITHATPVEQSENEPLPRPVSEAPPPPRQAPAPQPEQCDAPLAQGAPATVTREPVVFVPTPVQSFAPHQCAPASGIVRDVTVNNVSVNSSHALPQCAPAPVQYRDYATAAATQAGHASAPRPRVCEQDYVNDDVDRSRARDRKIDQLADAITNIARPRPIPRQAYELPIFNGNPAEWLAYKHMFWETSAQYNFKSFENLARLRTSLQGDAKLAVEDLLRTCSNPADIIKALDEEFGHPNLLLECALRKVRELPKISESGRELRHFSTVVRNCVSLLKNISANGYLNNPQLVSELLYKLTPVQRSQYGDFAMGVAAAQGIDVRVSPSLELLSEFLVHLARASSYYVQLDVPGPSSTAATKPRKPNPPISNRQRVHVAAESNDKSDKESKCTLCEEAHTLVKCDKFNKMNVDERWKHMKGTKLCFKCLTRKHSRVYCKAKRCDKCNYPHHILLHSEKKTESVTNVSDYTGKALLKVIPVTITADNEEKPCYALLDDGATVSLIDDSMVNNVTGERLPLTLRSARGLEVKDDASRVIRVTVRGPNSEPHEIKCRTFRNLDLPTQTVPAAVMEHAHIRDLGCEEMRGARPLLLLGQDNWELLVSEETRRGKSGRPVASLTKLGWVVHGPIGKTSQVGEQLVNCIAEPNVDLHKLVSKQFELESIGISEVPRSHKDLDRANNILDATSRQTESGSWEVGLLWRRDAPQLPDNYLYARQRLAGIRRRLTRDRVYAEAYNAQIDRLLKEGYASKLEGGLDSSPIWYLPHFGVQNPNKPGKLRLVFDAAAKYGGTSLNDNLLAGPDLLNSLLGVLFRFRLGPIAYTGDIADMFLRIKIREPDQGAQLFLWNSDNNQEPEVYKMNSMIFGAVSSPACAIYILNKNASLYRTEYPEAVEAIHSKHYMDDYLDSAWSVDQAHKLIEEVTHIHAKGGFVIRGWVANSQELLDRLQVDMPEKVSLDKGEGATERTLGMIWAPSSDMLAFDLSFKKLPADIVSGQSTPTKREFLRFIMSIFDPLGFLYPCIIQSRILMKKVWQSGIEWDQQLKDREAKLWFRWLGDLKYLNEIKIPRWYGLSLDNVDLHVFGDASESAYAAVAFIVGRNSEGNTEAAMVIGKARVAPQKVVSIPRLELQAAVLACRLADTVGKELGIKLNNKFLWSDSKTVLKWIHSDASEFQKFVSHRLAEIDRRSMRSDWRWVPSAMNPADKATRMDWPNNSREWLLGPEFLRLPQEQWPASTDLDTVPEDQLAASLSADSAILALRRLIARRGSPTDMYSDRGTNFVGAYSELRAALRDLDHERLQGEATRRGIMWHFNPPASPHMGGCWERLVRSVKNALRATLRERAPREEVLYTLLAEAELTINSRPLTYVTSDVEHPVVLTPNHLLLGTAAGDAPSTRPDAADLDSRRMWRRVNALADLFWRRWLREYLPTLQRRDKWTDSVKNVKVRDVVVLVDENKPRNQWVRGIIEKVYPGSDGVIRVVDVRTNAGVLRRPVVKVVVLPTDSVLG